MIGMVDDETVEKLIDEEAAKLYDKHPTLFKDRESIRLIMVRGAFIYKVAEIEFRKAAMRGELKLEREGNNGKQ